jgi:hypothetical protein
VVWRGPERNGVSVAGMGTAWPKFCHPHTLIDPGKYLAWCRRGREAMINKNQPEFSLKPAGQRHVSTIPICVCQLFDEMAAWENYLNFEILFGALHLYN